MTFTVKCGLTGTEVSRSQATTGLRKKNHLPFRGAKALDHPVFPSPSLPTPLQCVALSWSQNND